MLRVAGGASSVLVGGYIADLANRGLNIGGQGLVTVAFFARTRIVRVPQSRTQSPQDRHTKQIGRRHRPTGRAAQKVDQTPLGK